MKTRNIIKEEALAAVEGKHRAGIAVTVSGGKTNIGLSHMNERCKDSSVFLVAAPKKSIFKSWREEAEKFGFTHLLPHIRFVTYLSLHKEDLNVDGIYLDECHSLLEESHDLWLSAYQGPILGLTGTKPKYLHSEKGRMVQKYCPIVYEYETDDAVEDGIINDYKVVVHTLALSKVRNLSVATKSGSRFVTSEYDSYEYWTKRVNESFGKALQIARVQRMRALMNFPSKELLARKLLSAAAVKCIAFANTKEQADKLCKDSYHSGNPNSERNLEAFKKGEILKLSTILQLVEGINIPQLEEGIIMHSYGNERKTKQRLGRLLRLPTDQVATIHILCYRGTIDEKWVREATSDLDPEKVSWVEA